MAYDEVHGVLCREVGADFELRVADPIFCYRIKGKDYPAPKTKGILRTMIKQAARNDEELDRVMQALKRGLTWAEPSYSMSLYQWITQYTDNLEIIGVIRFFVLTAAGINLHEMPAGEYFRMMGETSFIRTQGFLPQGGGSLSGALTKVIERMGGEVWTRCPSLHIEVKDDVVIGAVVRKDGEEIEVTAQTVISNAGPWRTVGLVGGENLSPGYLKDVRALKSVPQFLIYIASDRPLLEGSSVLALTDSRRCFAIFNYSNICPEVAPKGKHLLVGAIFPTSSEPPYDFNKEIELTLQDLRDNIPDFDKYGRILRVNTYHGDWGLEQTWAGYSLPIKTPIEGLYVVGDASAPLGWWGSPAAVKSGRLAVEDIIQRFKPA
jgi:phytoene dehydrogenase-like protein